VGWLVQGAKVVMVDHETRQLVVTGVEADACYSCGTAGGIMARVARTATAELIRNPAADPEFRKYLDGGEVALDDMLVVPILASACTDSHGQRSLTVLEQAQAGGKDMHGEAKEGSVGTHGQEEPHPNVIAVMQVRDALVCHSSTFQSVGSAAERQGATVYVCFSW
jgi:hypothetical protein